MYEAVLFDFDGTLIPSMQFWLDAFKHALGEFGHHLPESSIIERCFYRDSSQIVAEFQLAAEPPFWPVVHKHLAVSYQSPVLFAGAKDVLEYCAKNKMPMGLVTSADRVFVQPALELLGIDKYFSVVITGDDVVNFKPHPEPVKKALDQLKLNPAQTLFVGDYVVDVLAGKGAGTQTAVFYTDDHSRFHKLELLQSAQPDFIFSDYSDFLARLIADGASADHSSVEVSRA